MGKNLLKLFILILLLVLTSFRGAACSTFLLNTPRGIFVGHNLDESVGFREQGMIYINKKNVYKEGRSWSDMYYYEKGEKKSPPISWISKYASITFSTRGRDFPDGGMNGAGLTISEMSLKGSIYRADKSLPSLLIELWVQYQLDNFGTVAEVIKNLPRVLLDGKTWHFMVTDALEKCAVIEFVKGKTLIYTGKDLMAPVLCNSFYAYECKRLKTYRGFGGTKPADPHNPRTPRFVQGAVMLKNYSFPTHESEVDYAFGILKKLYKNKSRRWENKWSYVFDIKNLGVYFNRLGSREIRFFSLKSFDKNCSSPVKMLEVFTPKTGDVTKYFTNYTYSKNHNFIRRADDALGAFAKNYYDWMKKENLKPAEFILRFAQYPLTTSCRGKNR